MSRTGSTNNGPTSRPTPTQHSNRSELDAVSRVENQLDFGYPELIERLKRIEAALSSLAQGQVAKDWYSTSEAAAILERSDWTVREWCRLGRVNAKKRQCGRGHSQEWTISHDELQRIRNEGLLPTPGYHHVR